MPAPIPTNWSVGRGQQQRAVGRLAPLRGVPNPPRPLQPPDAGAVQAPRVQALARRRSGDRAAILATVVTCVTVLVPWLVGRLVLRDTPLLPRDERLFDIRVREYGDYFPAELLAGYCIVGAVLALFLLIRPWRGRAISIVAALSIFTSVLVWGVPASRGLWLHQEDRLAIQLTTGPYPYNKLHPSNCSAYSVEYPADEGTWTVGIDSCQVLYVYEGWRQRSTVGPLPQGSAITQTFAFADGSTETSAFAALVRSREGQYLLGFGVPNSDRAWSRRVTNDDPTPASAVGSALLIDTGEAQGILGLGIDMRSGQTAWTVNCPRGYRSNGNLNTGGQIPYVACRPSRGGNGESFAIEPGGVLRKLE